MEYRVYDTKNPGEDMSEKDFGEAKADFDKEAKNGEHKDILEYKGYGKQRSAVLWRKKVKAG